MGQAEDKLITELMGETDYLSMELSLLEQRYRLATEEITRLRARVASLQAMFAEQTGQPPPPEPADVEQAGPRGPRQSPAPRRRGRWWHRQAAT
jgi:anti-sigma factor RsiW